jgi:cysteine desulfuration protein SufE
MSIQEREGKIVHDFGQFDDWLEKYSYLIELGKSIPKIDEKYRQDNYLIKGCQSRVWLHASYKDGRVYYKADSDAVITKGIAGMLIRLFDGAAPDEIINAGLGFLEKTGLKEHLSPTRSNGLLAMVKQMKLYALAFKTKASQNTGENQ